MASMQNILELKNVSYSYHSLHGETKALKNISFDVKEGEFIAIVGPSGCGKSTLLSIISGQLRQEQGNIIMRNPDGSDSAPRIGYMLQKDHLFEWLVSCFFGELCDSLVFLPIAFIGLMPLETLATMTVCQVLIKTGYEIIILPLTTLVAKKAKKYEEEMYG